MEHIEQEVISIDVVDVTIVGIEPFRRPGVYNRKPEAGVLKARLTFDDHRSVHDEGVLPAKAGAELLIRDTCTLASWASLLTTTFGFLPVLLMRRLGFLTGRLGVILSLLLRRFCFVSVGWRLDLALMGRWCLTFWFGTRRFLPLWLRLLARLLSIGDNAAQQQKGCPKGESESCHGYSPYSQCGDCGNPTTLAAITGSNQMRSWEIRMLYEIYRELPRTILDITQCRLFWGNRGRN
jgi:hypothetical protein